MKTVRDNKTVSSLPPRYPHLIQSITPLCISASPPLAPLSTFASSIISSIRHYQLEVYYLPQGKGASKD